MNDNQTFQNTILVNLLHDENFARKVLPHLKSDYFAESQRIIYSVIADFVAKYNVVPDHTALQVELQSSPQLKDHLTDSVSEILVGFNTYQKPNEKWMLDATEKWCQDRAVFNAVMESFSIIDGKNTTLTAGAIPELMQKALSVCFDTNIGHDYLEQAEERFEYYHLKENKIPFDLEFFNKITKGGVSKKSLSICLASTGVGKSLFLCHTAAQYLMQGKNVLYITLEMSQEKIAERIDENLMGVTMDELHALSKEAFLGKIAKLKSKSNGKLIVKEYPTGSAHSGHFRALINDLKSKKGFVPDAIMIDYINICASSRIKGGASNGTYIFVKSIAEEIRGLAVEFAVPVWSATQTNRNGYDSTDIGLEDVSESTGLAATADLMFALFSTEQLAAMNQLGCIQLKNRYNDVNAPKKFMLGCDKKMMRLYDLDSGAQMLSSKPEELPSFVPKRPFASGRESPFKQFKT